MFYFQFFWVVFILIILIIFSFLILSLILEFCEEFFFKHQMVFSFSLFFVQVFFEISTSPGILNHLNLMSSSTSAIWPWEIPALIFSRFKR